MGNNIKNYYGIALVVLGAVLLILGMLVIPMRDLLDQNLYTIGSLVLIIGGIIYHVIYNKKHLPEE
ncbi:MAG: hypothetical protein Q4A08_01910 [Bacteroidales bacterium]|nr:hypothetical protein [Bacteroidales bacterium]